jgi:hypothetical protein
LIEGLIFVTVLTSPMWLGYLVARPRLNPAIIKSLRKHRRHEVKSRLAVWDPSRGPSGRLIGRGHAFYSLDENGLVELLYRPHSGPERRLNGVLPPPPASSSGPLFVIGIYVAAAVMGDLLGYQLASGDDSRRSTVGVLAAMGGCAVAYMLLRIGLAASRRRGSKTTGAPE